MTALWEFIVGFFSSFDQSKYVFFFPILSHISITSTDSFNLAFQHTGEQPSLNWGNALLMHLLLVFAGHVTAYLSHDDLLLLLYRTLPMAFWKYYCTISTVYIFIHCLTGWWKMKWSFRIPLSQQQFKCKNLYCDQSIRLLFLLLSKRTAEKIFPATTFDLRLSCWPILTFTALSLS